VLPPLPCDLRLRWEGRDAAAMVRIEAAVSASLAGVRVWLRPAKTRSRPRQDREKNGPARKGQDRRMHFPQRSFGALRWAYQ